MVLDSLPLASSTGVRKREQLHTVSLGHYVIYHETVNADATEQSAIFVRDIIDTGTQIGCSVGGHNKIYLFTTTKIKIDLKKQQ